MSATEAALRLDQHGRNVVAEAARRRILARIGHRLTDPLIAILMVAGVVSGLTGDLASCAIIFAILSLSITLEVVQEHSAEAAAQALKRSVAVRAAVRRDGVAARIPVEDIVPGDIVELAAGDLVPADGIVLASRAAHTNESLLTGEPYPVEKRPIVAADILKGTSKNCGHPSATTELPPNDLGLFSLRFHRRSRRRRRGWSVPAIFRGSLNWIDEGLGSGR